MPQDTERGMFLVSLAPTFSLEPGAATAPSGSWTIRLKNGAVPAGLPIQLWVRRDDLLYGHPRRGRQSHFEDANYKRFDDMGRDQEDDDGASCVVRAGLLNAIATGNEPVVIGGFLRKEMEGGPLLGGRADDTAPRRRALSYRSRCAVRQRRLGGASRCARRGFAQRLGCRHERHQRRRAASGPVDRR